MPDGGDSAAERARAAVLSNCPKEVEAEVSEYMAESTANLFEDNDDLEGIRPELEALVEPFLEDSGVSAKDIASFCDAVLRAVIGGDSSGGEAGVALGSKAAAGAFAPPARAAPKDCLCRVPNLLLMYGGSPQPLLRNATLELVRGHRYGVVGANGTGKTTLMARIASKDIAGFPQDLRVVHLRHEAILRGVGKATSAREYAQLKNTGSTAASEVDLAKALSDVGFSSDDMLDKAVWALSGGWQMRLALACAVAQKANLMLLDEPTNHLDAEAVKWLVDFIHKTCIGGEAGGTAMIVSHDAAFLNQVCTHIVHFTSDAKLVYHPGTFDDFKATVLKGDEAKAQELLEVMKPSTEGEGSLMPQSLTGYGDRLVFPAPERIPGAAPGKLGPVVLTLKGSFTHSGADAPVLRDLACQLVPSSRVGIVGRNGSGKSTLLSLLAGRLPSHTTDLWSHGHLRLVYIAQHHDSQLGEFLNSTPMEYMQVRFRRGYDTEALPANVQQTSLTSGQVRRIRELAKKHGKRGKEVECILGRQAAGVKDGKDVIYEVKWKDLTPADNTFEKRSRLKGLGVEYLADEYDAWMAAAWGASPERPLTDRELIHHFQDFGLSEEIATKRKISMLSSGQRSKVMLAASFWTKPHIICLDEPTNYLDAEMVEALTQALRHFRGGYAIVSHSETFIAETCEEIWTVADGTVTVKHRAPLEGLPSDA